MSEKSHVFVVDDDVYVRAMICDVLTSGGFKTHQYASADEVETALTQWAPALIILDLSLADSDAIEVIHSLARARFAGSVLLLSGHDAATLEDVRSIGQVLARVEPVAPHIVCSPFPPWRPSMRQTPKSIASSAESVGVIWLGECTKSMI